MTNTSLRSLRPLAPLLLGLAIVLPTRAAAADGPPTAAAETRSGPARRGSVLIDPLGFVMFGPRIGVETGGAHLTGGVYGRWFDAGLLGRSLFLNDGDSFAFSYGIGARGRYYFGESQSGLHVGAGAEYLRSRVENQAALVVTTSGYVIPYGEIGYRYPFGSFFAGASAVLGYAALLSGRVDNLPGGNNAGAYAANNESSVYGSAALEAGVYF